MTGLLIIGVYCFFWWLCWKFTGLFLKEKTFSLGVKRFTIFLVIAATPYCYYLYEKAQYDAACESVEVFFPEEKIDLPESFMTSSNLKGNNNRRLFGWFDYIVSPINTQEKLKLNKETVNLTNLAVYPHEERISPITEDKKTEIKLNVRYGLLYERSSVSEHVSVNTTKIFDFVENRPISSYSQVSYSRGLHTLRHYIFPFSFNSCYYENDRSEHFDFKFKTFFDRTFNHLEGAKQDEKN